MASNQSLTRISVAENLKITNGSPDQASEWATGRGASFKMSFIAPLLVPIEILAMRRYPFSFLALTSLGVLCVIPGALSLAGFGGQLHPILNDPMAGLAFLVSAVALIGSGLFPLVIAKLKEGEEA